MKPEKSVNKRQNAQIGRLGEDIALKFLKDRGYELVMQNYRKPFAEIDIICRKGDLVHFVEVKTVSYGTKADLDRAVSYGIWRPEEQVHSFKLRQIGKGIQAWLAENYYLGAFQIDVVAVRVVPREAYASVKMIDNVILE
jgi:putative endonuclease